MFRPKALLSVSVVVCALMAVAVAANPPMKKPKADAKAPKPPRVYAPYHDLGLDADQSLVVGSIQADYRARIAKLEDERDAKILAHLTANQLATLQANEDAAAAKRKAAYERAYAKRKAAAEKKSKD